MYVILQQNGQPYACGPKGDESVQLFSNPKAAQNWIGVLGLGPDAKVVPAELVKEPK
jgi:hypothetical protein